MTFHVQKIYNNNIKKMVPQTDILSFEGYSKIFPKWAVYFLK